jgi:hypothetical protein
MVTGELLFDPKGEEERKLIRKYNDYYKIFKKPVARRKAAINLPKDIQEEYDEDRKHENETYYGDCDDTNEEDLLEEEKDEQNEKKNKNGDGNTNAGGADKKKEDKKNRGKDKDEAPRYDRDEDHLSLFISHLSPFSRYVSDERCVRVVFVCFMC